MIDWHTKAFDAVMYHPWPGVLADQLGLYVAGLETGPGGYAMRLCGLDAGVWAAARSAVRFDPNVGWEPWDEVRFVVGTVAPSANPRGVVPRTRTFIPKLCGTQRHLFAFILTMLQEPFIRPLHRLCRIRRSFSKLYL